MLWVCMDSYLVSDCRPLGEVAALIFDLATLAPE
jgi:hypothetical protein